MSPGAAKATKAGALIDELERLDFSEALDDLAIRRLSRDARALMPVDAMGAHTVLGGISGIEGDAVGVREHYRIALELSRRNPSVLGNYATALGRAGELDEAFPAVMEAHRRAPDDLTLLGHAILVAMQGAWFREGLRLCETWNKLRPDHPVELEPVMRGAADAVRRGAFTEEGARKVLCLAHEIRVAAKVRYAGTAVRAVFDEPDRFSFTLYVRTDTRHAVELEARFVECVVTDVQLMADPGLMFVPMFKGTTVDGGDSRTVP